MICDDNKKSPLSIDFTEAGTLYPEEISYSTSDKEYDTLICKFGSETAQHLYENRNDGLNKTQRATVLKQGEPIKAMYYEPDFLTLGDSIEARDYYGVLELHDLHEHLKKGIIDYAPQSATVEEVYRKIWSARDDSEDILTGLKLNIGNMREQSVDDALGFTNNSEGLLGVSSPINDKEILDVDYDWVINFDQQSPLKSIQEANNKFSLNSHISPQGKLIIGQYDTSESFKADKSRNEESYLIKNVAISGHHSDLGKLIVESGLGSFDGDGSKRLENVIEYWNPFDDASGRVRGRVVVETDTGGRTVEVEAHEIKPNPRQLLPVAKRALKGILARNPSGKLSLDFTNGKNSTITVGDKIEVAEPNTCGSFVDPSYGSNEYIVSGVSHDYNGSWDVTLDIINDFTDEIEINTTFEYWDISEDQTYTAEELYGDIDTEDGFLRDLEAFLQ